MLNIDVHRADLAHVACESSEVFIISQGHVDNILIVAAIFVVLCTCARYVESQSHAERQE